MNAYDESDSLSGKRGINVGRVSTEEQAHTPSVSKQLEINRNFAKKEGISIIEELRLEGLSASSHDHEPFLRPLIERKEKQNDFDVLLFMDFDRFSRDIRAGRRLWDDFLDVGVEIVSATEPRVTGELAFMQQDMALYKGQSYVSSFAKHTSTGWAQAVKDGRLLPVTNVIFGLDKLFLSAEGTPLFILRDLPDGRKVKLNPQDGSVIEYIIKRKGEKAVQKKKSEIIRPILGNPIHVKIVRDIFRWHFLYGLRRWTIAKKLNEQGIRSPQGKDWCESSVIQLLMNTIYTGTSLGFRRSYSKMVMRGKNGPFIHKRPRRKVKGMKGYKVINRPKDDWMIVEVPETATFLDEDVRVLAKKWQWDRLKQREERAEKRKVLNSDGRKSGGNRHDPNLYFLTGKMRSKQGDYLMKGWSRGKWGKSPAGPRCYVIGRFLDTPVPAGDPRSRMIPAEMIENQVLEALAETLARVDVEQYIAKHVRRYFEARLNDQQDINGLKGKLKEIENQAELLTQGLSDDAKELFRKKAERLAEEGKRLRARIEATSLAFDAPTSEKAVADIVKSQFCQLAEILKGRKLGTMRALIDLFVSRCVADLEARQVEIEFSIPVNMLMSGKIVTSEQCLVSIQGGSDGHRAHPENTLMLAKYRMTQHLKMTGRGKDIWFTRERIAI